MARRTLVWLAALDWKSTPFPLQTPGPVAANGCDDTCGVDPQGGDGTLEGLLNHLRWPFNQTLAMLDFFRAHPRSSQPFH
jgi:hypothetical protein